MAYGLFLPRRWTRQPQGPVEVDWRNPISRGLFFVGIPGRLALVLGGRATQELSGNFAVGAGADGLAAKAPATQLPGYVSWPVSLSHAGDFAMAVLARPSTDTATSIPTQAAVSSYLTYITASAGGFVAHADNNMAGAGVANAEYVGRTTLYGVDRSGNQARKWRAGRPEGSGTTGTRPFEPTDFLIGRGKTGNNLQNAETFLFVVWLRSLLSSEWWEIGGNPHQLLKPRRPVLYSFPSGGAVHELAGDATAGASAAGSLTTAIQLDGDANAGATASGDLATGIPLAGDAAAAAQASGTLSTEIRLAAAALVSATATGSLSTAINLAGSAAFASLADGTLTTQIRLAGDAIAGAVADAGLSTQILLDADAQAGADASGELTTVPSGLAGDAVAGATASGALSVQIILAGDALAAVLASGDLTTAGAGAALEGDATVLAIASGGLTTAIQLTGAPVISVTASGELSIGLGMTAEALATVSASAVLSTQIRMEGAAVASALAAGALNTLPALGTAIPHTRRIGRPRVVFGARRIGPERVTFAAGRIGRKTMIGD